MVIDGQNSLYSASYVSGFEEIAMSDDLAAWHRSFFEFAIDYFYDQIVPRQYLN